ncbi:hypothetical protein FA13DRAFT_780574 [Coprinellus micaceus]|uniref:Uncharacterized protein n=1 Tax=Coprinellus micaceus TaxID=71717 RepID=A0A4Y7S713_COPMI|nr:hypothetical protein FA13DRAFT_780574 [Coprinellus micaceus]
MARTYLFWSIFPCTRGTSPARGVLDSRVSLHGVQGRGMRATVSSCPPNRDTVEDLAFDLIRRDWAVFGDLLPLFLSICTSKCFTIACIHPFDCLPFFLGAHVSWVARARGRCVHVDLIFFTPRSVFWGIHRPLSCLRSVSRTRVVLTFTLLSHSRRQFCRTDPFIRCSSRLAFLRTRYYHTTLHSHLSIMFPIFLCRAHAQRKCILEH